MENAPKFWKFSSLVNFYSKCKRPLTFENWRRRPYTGSTLAHTTSPSSRARLARQFVFLPPPLSYRLSVTCWLSITSSLSLLSVFTCLIRKMFTTITTNLYYDNYYYSHSETNQGETGEDLIRKSTHYYHYYYYSRSETNKYSQKYCQ